MADTVVLWGIALLPHGQQWEERLKWSPPLLRVWRCGYCCTFSTAEQDECLEHSMGEHSVRQVWSCVRNVVSAQQPFKKRKKGEKRETAMEIQKRGNPRCYFLVVYILK